MAYDVDLAERLREALAGQKGLSEKKMFGGLAFLIDGNMAIVASRQGGVLVRSGPAREDELLRSAGVTVAVMGGRPMSGWLRVEAAQVKTKAQLSKWVAVGTGCARSLPPKAARARPRRGP